jgi:hypothetical protein
MGEDPLVRLKQIGRCLDRIEDENGSRPTFPLEFSKVCFLCINTSSIFLQNLGFSPLNDAVQFAKAIRAFEFAVYFIQNPLSSTFMKFFDLFIKGTSEHFVLFYSGHGIFAKTVKSTLSPDRSVPADPLVFDDGSVSDETILSHLSSNSNPRARFTFVTDCCAGESIWNVGGGTIHGLTVPSNFISISSIADVESLQTLDSATLTAFIAPQSSKRPKPVSTLGAEPASEEAPITVTPTLKSSSVPTLSSTLRSDGPPKTGPAIGLFTKELCKWLKKNPEITCKELSLCMRKVMKKSHQQFVVGSSQDSLLTIPIFG